MTTFDAVRRAASYYDASYPPDVLGGGGGVVLTSLTPPVLMLGAPKIVTCHGSGYSDTSQVFRDGVDVTGGWGGDPTVLEYVDPNDTPGPHSIRVHDGGKQSPARTLTVVPAPVVAAFTPASVVAGVPTPVVVTGSNFTPALAASIQLTAPVLPQVDHAVTYVSPTELHFTANLPTPGTGLAWVQYNSTDTSNTVPFAVTATREGEEIDVYQEAPKPRRKNGNGG